MKNVPQLWKDHNCQPRLIFQAKQLIKMEKK